MGLHSPRPLDGRTHNRIGIDFDNTIVCYDDIFLSAAKERGLLPADFAGSKKELRDAIRRESDGELAWQKLQSYVYSRGLDRALPFEGLEAFLARCREAGHEILIVSHKTEFGHFDSSRTNLRTAALSWLEERGFFSKQFGLQRENVFFEPTRAEKIHRINAIDCGCFIDDLEEVFAEPAFPQRIKRILFSAQPLTSGIELDAVCPTWSDVETAVFDV
jgi:hypothetical protein